MLKFIEPKEDFNTKDIKASLKPLTYSSAFSQVMDVLTTGTFIIAFAIELNASNLMIGLLTAVPFLSQIAQISMNYLLERIRKRKLLEASAYLFSRSFLFFAMFASIISNKSVALYFLAFCMVFRHIFAAASIPAWNSWIRDLIPAKIMGRYFARRLKYVNLATIGASLIGAYLVDFVKNNHPEYKLEAYGFLMFIAGIFGFIGIYFLTKVCEPPMSLKNPEDHIVFKEKAIEPFKNPNFRKLIAFLCCWNFAFYLASPFFTVYMLRRLGLDVLSITTLTVLSQIVFILVINIWGIIADRYSYKSILLVSLPVYIFTLFLWIFTSRPEPHLFTMPLLIIIHILSGIATAGIILGTGTITLKLAPKGSGSLYLSLNAIVTQLFAAAASIIGGFTADALTHVEFSFVFKLNNNGNITDFSPVYLRHWDFFFIFAIIFGVISLKFLERIIETGEVNKNIVISEFLKGTKKDFFNNAFALKNALTATKRLISLYEYEEIVEEDPITKEKKKKIIKKYKKYKKNGM